MLADLHLLKKEYKESKSLYRQQLQLPTITEGRTAHILNNLAYASW
jgi:hypothetical protein